MRPRGEAGAVMQGEGSRGNTPAPRRGRPPLIGLGNGRVGSGPGRAGLRRRVGVCVLEMRGLAWVRLISASRGMAQGHA